MKIYKVGGAVRDSLLGVACSDVDYVVVGSTVAEMKQNGFMEVGKGFPVFLHPVTKEEYALARKEIKTGDKHTDFNFVFTPDITLKEDLERRDFTCNAIAYDPLSGEYIDYFGGREDIKNKILRHVNAGHFVEDPLRVLRLCRFAAQLDFTPDAKTVELCKFMVASGMLEYLTTERVWKEVYRAMTTRHFYRFIELARSIGALKVIMPEVDALWQVPEKLQFHPEGNSGDHTLTALKRAQSASPLVNFAILLHDVGKTMTPQEELPSHKLHELRGGELIYKLCNRLKVPNRYREFAAMACKQHMKFHYIPEMRPGSLYNLAVAMVLGHVCYVNEYIQVCRADFYTTYEADNQQLRHNFEQSALKLQKACEIINAVKASDMPKFDELPKDETFKNRLREYKIKILREKLF